jgi:hypothetical protein
MIRIISAAPCACSRTLLRFRTPTELIEQPDARLRRVGAVLGPHGERVPVCRFHPWLHDKLMGVDGQPKLAKGDEDPSHTAPVALAVVILPGQS